MKILVSKLNKEEINRNNNDLFAESDHHNLKNILLLILMAQIFYISINDNKDINPFCIQQILASFGLKCRFDK